MKTDFSKFYKLKRFPIWILAIFFFWHIGYFAAFLDDAEYPLDLRLGNPGNYFPNYFPKPLVINKIIAYNSYGLAYFIGAFVPATFLFFIGISLVKLSKISNLIKEWIPVIFSFGFAFLLSLGSMLITYYLKIIYVYNFIKPYKYFNYVIFAIAIAYVFSIYCYAFYVIAKKKN